MQCMKCGKDTGEGQVFCDGCLAEMEKYPVKPGTHVYIPRRRPVFRRPVYHSIQNEPEEQIRRLRSRIRWLTFWLISALAAAAALGVLVFYLYTEPPPSPSTGQDYNVSETDQGTAGTNGRRIR